jgi:hypothetical protein
MAAFIPKSYLHPSSKTGAVADPSIGRLVENRNSVDEKIAAVASASSEAAARGAPGTPRTRRRAPSVDTNFSPFRLTQSACSKGKKPLRITEDDLKQNPLTFEEFKNIVANYNRQNEMKIQATIVNGIGAFSASALDFIIDPDDTKQLWAFKFDGSPHFTFVYGEIIDDTRHFVITDSAGAKGTYAPQIEIVLRSFQTKASVEVLTFGPRRQFDQYSCGIFVLNDMKFFTRNSTPLQDIMTFGELKSKENGLSLIVRRPPPGIMRVYQSYRKWNESISRIYDGLEGGTGTYSEASLARCRKIFEEFTKPVVFIPQGGSHSKGRTSPINTYIQAAFAGIKEGRLDQAPPEEKQAEATVVAGSGSDEEEDDDFLFGSIKGISLEESDESDGEGSARATATAVASLASRTLF